MGILASYTTTGGRGAHVALPQSKSLHANSTVLLGPAVPCQAEWVLWSLSEVALLLCQTSTGTGVKVGGGLDFCPNPEGPPQPISCQLKLLLLVILLRP